jgi:predicted nucleotidyltransferase
MLSQGEGGLDRCIFVVQRPLYTRSRQPLPGNNRMTPPRAADQVASRAAAAFARSLVAEWQAALGSELLGVYLIGSLAHGGFSRRYSDVDMAVIAEAGLRGETIDRVRAAAAALSPEWGPKLSVFWADRRFAIGRFPPLDRIDYIERPVVLAERERAEPLRPTLQETRAYLRGLPLANWAERARAFAAAAALEPKDRKAYLRALLYPARFCYAYTTGRMASNDDAVGFLRERPPAGIDLASIEQALACRRAAADPDPLFALRAVLPAQVAACAALIGSSQ